MSRADQATELRAEVFADGDLTPRLKLFTLAAIHLWETAPSRPKMKEFRKESWAYRAMRLAGETGTTEELTPRLRWMIADDVPKYRLPTEPDHVCVGTMLRPAGAPCKRRANRRSTRPNPLTGERSWIGACKDPRHQQQYEAIHRDAWAAWRDNGEPAPKPNSGGILLRYFRTGIEALYAWADRDYTHGDTVTASPPDFEAAGIVTLADFRRTSPIAGDPGV